MTELSTHKVYEFFLKDFLETEKSGYPRFLLTWAEVESNYTIKELHALVEKDKPGPRLLALMERIQPGASQNPMKAKDFFKRGMPLFAKVQAQWVEARVDKIEYQFNYETISTKRQEQTQITEAQKTKARHIFRKGGTYEKAIEIAKRDDPGLVWVLQTMQKSGELALAS